MRFKKNSLVVGFLVILIWLFLGNFSIVKAQTAAELQTQITTLQTQIAQLKNQLTEIEKKLTSIATAVSKLTPVTVKPPTKPETEYQCPDVNRDGVVDAEDLVLVIGAANTCSGNAKYNAKADFDGDNCVTNTDTNFVNKYVGKLTGAITQCKWGVTPGQIETMVTSVANAISRIAEGIKALIK